MNGGVVGEALEKDVNGWMLLERANRWRLRVIYPHAESFMKMP
jgi:hypothetical protein